MDIIVRVAGDIVIDNEIYGGDIQPPRRNVRRNEDARSRGAEASEVICAVALREAGVQGSDAVVEVAEEALEEVSGGGAVGEDDDGAFSSVAWGGE